MPGNGEQSSLSGCHDGLDDQGKPVNSHADDTSRHMDTASISVVIPPLDLSTLHRRDSGENYFFTFFTKFQVKFSKSCHITPVLHSPDWLQSSECSRDMLLCIAHSHSPYISASLDLCSTVSQHLLLICCYHHCVTTYVILITNHRSLL